MKQIVIAGECMVELSGPPDAMKLGFGGDTLNAAIYAARLAGPRAQVSYVTRLGSDQYSRAMRQAWENDGIDTTLASEIEGRTSGLYAISTDETGERSFTYWRDSSPARELFLGQHTERELAAFAQADVVYTSGITLAILSATGRSNLLYAMHEAKSRGAMVGFDPNYRARLWDSADEAAAAISDALAASTLVFASPPEQRVLFGDKDRTDIGERLKGAGVDEWVVRDGSGPVTLGARDAQSDLVVSPVANPVDTTGAGDAFSGAYIAQRSMGRTPRQAGEVAAALSARVIQHRGAVLARDLMRDLIETSNSH